MTQIIRTKYHGPSNVRGSRVSATTASGIRKMFEYDDALSLERNYVWAARKLAESLNWSGSWIGGHDKSGMVFVKADFANIVETRFWVD